jgi:hypothetical protein
MNHGLQSKQQINGIIKNNKKKYHSQYFDFYLKIIPFLVYAG